MRAVILAAGTGERLRPFTADRPKAMVDLCDRPLLTYTLDALAAVGVTDVAVVGGHGADIVQAWLAAHAPQVTLLHNPDYTLGSLLTLQVARKFCAGHDFVLCNADHLFNPGVWALVPRIGDTIRAFCDFDRTLGADDMKVATDQRTTVRAIHKQLATYDGGYIGLTTVPATAGAAYWRAVDATRAQHGDRAVVEWVLGMCIAQQVSVAICDAGGHGWAEIDTPDELQQAQTFVRAYAA